MSIAQLIRKSRVVESRREMSRFRRIARRPSVRRDFGDFSADMTLEEALRGLAVRLEISQLYGVEMPSLATLVAILRKFADGVPRVVARGRFQQRRT